MAAHKSPYVWLDISHKGQQFVEHHFPNLVELTRRYNRDLSTTRVPVSPAAHYTCGGIAADLSGRTSVAGLYAVGEVANCGLHGANRLASNSLLECVVMGKPVPCKLQVPLLLAAKKYQFRSPPSLKLAYHFQCYQAYVPLCGIMPASSVVMMESKLVSVN